MSVRGTIGHGGLLLLMRSELGALANRGEGAIVVNGASARPARSKDDENHGIHESKIGEERQEKLMTGK